MTEAIPGRTCGDCTVCCIVPGIDTHGIQKRTGAACRNCSGADCAIYLSRPKACRDFFCAWMQDATLPEDWRPDRSGVFVQAVDIQGRPALSLMLIADALKTVRQAWFADFVQGRLRGGTLLVLALPGPKGTRSAKALLNTPQMGQAAAGSAEQVRQLLRGMVKTMMDSKFEELPLQNTGNDVSLP